MKFVFKDSLMAIHTPIVKNTDSKYFTVGTPTPPERDRGLVKETTDEHEYVRVFISHDSAVAYRDRYVNGLSIHNWDSLTPLALQMERRNNKIPFIYLEAPVGTDPTFELISIDDFLK